MDAKPKNSRNDSSYQSPAAASLLMNGHRIPAYDENHPYIIAMYDKCEVG